MPANSKRKVTDSDRAGIDLSASKASHIFYSRSTSKNKSRAVGVFVAAVVEGIIKVLLDTAYQNKLNEQNESIDKENIPPGMVITLGDLLNGMSSDRWYGMDIHNGISSASIARVLTKQERMKERKKK